MFKKKNPKDKTPYKDWNSNLTFSFRYKNEFGRYKKSTLKLHNIYKFGINYEKIPRKNGEGFITNMKPIGFIISIRSQNFNNVYFKYIHQLRTMLRKHGSYRILKKTEVESINKDGVKTIRENTLYLAKADKYQKYKSITVNRKTDKKEKRKYNTENLMKKRKESGFYENRKPRGPSKKKSRNQRESENTNDDQL